jgi:hypothetical protein
MVIEEGWANDQIRQILKDDFGIDSSAHIPAEKFAEVWKRFNKSGFSASDADLPEGLFPEEGR